MTTAMTATTLPGHVPLPQAVTPTCQITMEINGKPPWVFFSKIFNALLIFCFSFFFTLTTSTTTTTTTVTTTHQPLQPKPKSTQHIEMAMAATEAEAEQQQRFETRHVSSRWYVFILFYIILILFLGPLNTSMAAAAAAVARDATRLEALVCFLYILFTLH